MHYEGLASTNILLESHHLIKKIVLKNFLFKKNLEVLVRDSRHVGSPKMQKHCFETQSSDTKPTPSGLELICILRRAIYSNKKYSRQKV